LSVHPSLERFRPELDFVCRFLERSYALTARSDDGHKALHYGPEPPAGAIAIPAVLFPDGVRLDADGIHPEFDALKAIESRTEKPTLLPWGSGKLDYDALGLIFFLLSRIEERNNPHCARDRYGRHHYDASLLHRRAALNQPLADIAAREVARSLTGVAEPEPATEYRVWITHDVDKFRNYHRPIEPLKKAAGDVIFRRAPGLALRRLWSSYQPGEPWSSCRRLMDLSEKHGHRSRFYFMGPSDHPMDSPYVLREPKALRRLCGEITSRGHIIGFHPGAAAKMDLATWSEHKRLLEEAIGCEVTEGRQHGLLFDITDTWDIWNDAGMKTDATLGYPERSGFRSGTCRSHPTFSLRKRRTLDLIEMPTAILDFGFFGGKYRDLTIDQALAECQDIIDTCREHRGDLVVLFHSHQTRPPASTFYEALLERL